MVAEAVGVGAGMGTTAHVGAAVVEELSARSQQELLELFLTLPPLAAADVAGVLAGELHGRSPDYLVRHFAASAAADGYGDWLGKGFVPGPPPGGEWLGHGYNMWRTAAGETRRIRFAWGAGSSLLDGRPVARIEYAPFANSYAELDLRDEVRVLGEGLLLGVATTAQPSAICPDPGGPGGRSRPTTFLLYGLFGPALGPDAPGGELRPA